MEIPLQPIKIKEVAVLNLLHGDARYGEMTLFVVLDKEGAPLAICGDAEVVQMTWPDGAAILEFPVDDTEIKPVSLLRGGK